MTEQEALQLRDWALDYMAWERAYAKAKGKTVPYIRGGSKLPGLVQEALRSNRIGEAVNLITEAVKLTYRVRKTA